MGIIEFRIWPHVGFPDRVDWSREIYLYCKTGGRCALAAVALTRLGFTKVKSVDMRLDDWVAAGYAIEQ